MKLYWYQNYKVFHCYTECNESMSIFELYMKYIFLNTNIEAILLPSPSPANCPKNIENILVSEYQQIKDCIKK